MIAAGRGRVVSLQGCDSWNLDHTPGQTYTQDDLSITNCIFKKKIQSEVLGGSVNMIQINCTFSQRIGILKNKTLFKILLFVVNLS